MNELASLPPELTKVAEATTDHRLISQFHQLKLVVNEIDNCLIHIHTTLNNPLDFPDITLPKNVFPTLINIQIHSGDQAPPQSPNSSLLPNLINT